MWLLFMVLGTSVSFGEYRVFELEFVRPPNQKPVRKYVSTLDPLQYPKYYSLGKGEVVQYKKTWMCKGPTPNFKSHCPPPKPPPLARSQNGSSAQKGNSVVP